MSNPEKTKPKDLSKIKEGIKKIIPEERRQRLTRQAGGTATFLDYVDAACVAADKRNFPGGEAQTIAFAVITLVRRCGSAPGEEDLKRFSDTATKVSNPAKK